tara:strand:- start:28882 stop:29268 length:387 start_codon:yes stop_codon:yes gene_type:complete
MTKSMINLFILLKNAAYFQQRTTQIFFNQIFIKLLKILYQEGLILSYKVTQKNSKTNITIYLRYLYQTALLKELKILSTNTRPVFISYKELCFIDDINAFFLLATTKGFLSNIQCKTAKIGGKLLIKC